MATRASGRGRGPQPTAASSRGGGGPPEGVLQQHAAADRATRGLQRLPVARILGSSGVVSPQPQDAPQLLPPGRVTGSVNRLAVLRQEVRPLVLRQLVQNPLRVQRILALGRL